MSRDMLGYLHIKMREEIVFREVRVVFGVDPDYSVDTKLSMDFLPRIFNDAPLFAEETGGFG